MCAAILVYWQKLDLWEHVVLMVFMVCLIMNKGDTLDTFNLVLFLSAACFLLLTAFIQTRDTVWVVSFASSFFKHLCEGKERNFTLSLQCYFCHYFQIYTKTGQRHAVISQWIFSVISVLFVFCFFSCFWFFFQCFQCREGQMWGKHTFENNTVVCLSETRAYIRK